MVDLDAAGSDGGETENSAGLSRNVGDADVMRELVLACIALEESVEIKIT